ncbi:MAG: galactose mutarotase [Chitinispirillaceae bacterium]|nr:galactose mutarotase [Chitinispirillaceae bacterium]
MAANGKRHCSVAPFGRLPDGRQVDQYSLVNAHGNEITLITYGATVVSIIVPDRTGTNADISLGFDNLAGYLQQGNPFFGSTIGRYGNRIARGKFTLNGVEYTLAINNGVNHLHGGPGGFDKVLWSAQPIDADDAQVTMTYLSPDGEEGYPGTLNVAVRFLFTDNNELEIDYKATTDAVTIVNLTNHTYFNLNGTGTVLDHLLQINAPRFTPIDETSIPLGEISSVAGTSFDFTRPKRIGEHIDRVEDIQIKNGCGYDHNFVFSAGEGLRTIANVVSEQSGRTLEVATTEPGVQFYSGNFLDGSLQGKGGVTYVKRSGFCLETQHFPDSPNRPAFPATVLKPDETYTSQTVFRFGVAGWDAAQ